MFNYRLASDTLYLVQRIHSLNINIRFSVVSCNKTWLFSSMFRVSLFLRRRGFMFRGFVFRCFVFEVLCSAILRPSRFYVSKFCVRGFVLRGFVFAVINVNQIYRPTFTDNTFTLIQAETWAYQSILTADLNEKCVSYLRPKRIGKYERYYSYGRY